MLLLKIALPVAPEVTLDWADWAAALGEVEDEDVMAVAVDMREVVTGAVAVVAADVELTTAPETITLDEGDDDDVAETTSETGPCPMALAAGTGTGVSSRTAFWYHSAPNRSGMHLASQPCCFKPG